MRWYHYGAAADVLAAIVLVVLHERAWPQALWIACMGIAGVLLGDWKHRQKQRKLQSPPPDEQDKPVGWRF
jgi:hypothetical protein